MISSGVFASANHLSIDCIMRTNWRYLHEHKRPLGIDPGGHHFVVLNVSDNTPVFVSAVVTFRGSKPVVRVKCESLLKTKLRARTPVHKKYVFMHYRIMRFFLLVINQTMFYFVWGRGET